MNIAYDLFLALAAIYSKVLDIIIIGGTDAVPDAVSWRDNLLAELGTLSLPDQAMFWKAFDEVLLEGLHGHGNPQDN